MVKTHFTKWITLDRKGKKVIPEGLVGPSSAVPVQIEGIYAKAVLDTGSQLTLLYRSFYDKHQPLTSIDALQIWGLSSAYYHYDSYPLLKLEFLEADLEVAETIDALVLVCPDPVVGCETFLLVGTNTSTRMQTCRGTKIPRRTSYQTRVSAK